MSKHAAELSALLVGEIYGELFSVIYQKLLRFGRLGLGPLVRRVALPVVVVKSALAVLIQQGLVLHHTVENGDGTSYEANWTAAYCLLRSGKTLQLVGEHLGANALILMTELLIHGHLRIRDLEELFLRSKRKSVIQKEEIAVIDKETPSKVLDQSNGFGGQHEITEGYVEDGKTLLDTTLRSLYLEGYIDRIGTTDFYPFADLLEEAEAEVMRLEYPSGLKSGAQEKINLQQSIESQVRTWTSQKGDALGPQQRGIKRDRDDDDEQVTRSKKLKAETETEGDGSNIWNNHSHNGFISTENDRSFKPNSVIGVNHSRCMMPHRDSVLTHAAEVRVGHTASLVYKFLLQQLSHRSNRKRMKTTDHNKHHFSGDDDGGEKHSMFTFTTEELIDGIQDEDLVAFDRLTAKPVSSLPPSSNEAFGGVRKQYKPGLSNGISEELLRPNGEPKLVELGQSSATGVTGQIIHNLDDDAATEGTKADEQKLKRQSNGLRLPDERKSRIPAFDSYLEILAEDSYHFVRCVKVQETSKWMVDHKKVASKLRQHELENIVCQRFGDMALRIFRFLHRKGKMDEKKIQASTLIKMKQVRATLSILHSAGYLELQEVPRDNARQVSRNIYLWFSDPDRCRQVVLETTYQAISRCLQRASYERDQLRTLLDKAERSDVKENPDELLTVIEKAKLHEWKLKEERLLVQVGRLDELVAIFRDY